jgi:uncharacterized protein (TIGR03067 family)
MRTACFLLLAGLVAAAGCGGKTATTSTGSPDGAPAVDDNEAVQGAWKVTKVDFPTGMAVPAHVDLGKTTFVVEGKVVKVVQEGRPESYLAFVAYPTDRPKRVRIAPAYANGKEIPPPPSKGPPPQMAFTCIYKLEGDALTVALPSYAGGKLPTAFAPAAAEKKVEEDASPDEKTGIGVLYLTRVAGAAPPKTGTSAAGSAGTKK